QRENLRNAEPGHGLQARALVFGRVLERADADDAALTLRQPRNRVNRADTAGIRQRNGGAGEVIGTELAVAGLADDVLISAPVLREVERVGLLDIGYEQRSRTVLFGHVDGQPE